MKLASHAVRFALGNVPVVGNVRTGVIVGLTPEGAALCDELQRRNIDESEVMPGCVPLVAYLEANGFMEKTGQESPKETLLASAYLHVSNRCNLECVGCYSADASRNVARDPSFKELSNALELLSDLGVERLVISGGEPFMRADLGDIAYAAKSFGMREVAVLTNGTLCTPNRLVALRGVVDIISISFDGASASAPAHIRGAQLYDKLVDAVGAVQRAGIRSHILPTIHAGNVGDIPAYIELGRRLGATVGFSLLSGAPSALGKLFLNDLDLRHLADTMIDVVKSGNQAQLGDALNPALPLVACVGCGAGVRCVSVAVDGSVYPCHMLHNSELSLGNAFHDTPMGLRDALRSFALPTVDELEGCTSCEKRYLCGGGCRARACLAYGRLDAGDPYCAYYQRIIRYSAAVFLDSLFGR